jgi:hypothetical protein
MGRISSVPLHEHVNYGAVKFVPEQFSVSSQTNLTSTSPFTPLLGDVQI